MFTWSSELIKLKWRTRGFVGYIPIHNYNVLKFNSERCNYIIFMLV